uniref:Neuropeptide KY n=1 Tax=Platynereis dumerilii TaxID=6359 RepID=V5TE00_PLADU|nr:neuropeptide KY precursor [Platynereis dumerilii]
MKQFILLVLSVSAYITLCVCEDSFSDWLQRGHVARRSAPESRLFGGKPKSKRDSNYAIKMLMEELLNELNESEERHKETQMNQMKNLLEKEMSKRKAFWQPMMGGPLPVETRLASFGSRIEPDRTEPGSGPNGIKAMRYGRR